jgi:predicted PolB exonuclease-like 3'-5' exonuclease
MNLLNKTSFGKVGEFLFEQELIKRNIYYNNYTKRWSKKGCDFLLNNNKKIEVGIARLNKMGQFVGHFNKLKSDVNTYDLYVFITWFNEYRYNFYIIPTKDLINSKLKVLVIGRHNDTKTYKRWANFKEKWELLK